jgi:hypothetical protein
MHHKNQVAKIVYDLVAGQGLEIEFEVGMIHELMDDYSNASSWVPFDFMDIDSRPPIAKKYLICRKDGKIHWEQWNGSGWAYNHNEIRYWAEIRPPMK